MRIASSLPRSDLVGLGIWGVKTAATVMLRADVMAVKIFPPVTCSCATSQEVMSADG
jgi:hypothetical protein